MGLMPVGILGGMGPQATVLLMQKVIDAVPAREDDEHVPLLVDQNPQIPSRLKHLLDGVGEDPGPVLALMAKRLERAGAMALAMPCNTAHHYAAVIKRASGLPFLDMIALSVEHAVALKPIAGIVGVLASPAVKKVGVFDAAMKAGGLRPIFSDNDDALVAAIKSLKSYGPTDGARETLRQASAELLAKGATVQLIACTEFSLIAEDVAPGVLSFDALDRLADAIVAFSGARGGHRTDQAGALMSPGFGQTEIKELALADMPASLPGNNGTRRT
jgi:aspartate racemase